MQVIDYFQPLVVPCPVDCEVEAAFLNFAVDYHGQQAGLQTFSLCDLVACPLPPDKQVNLTVSMTPPELPEKLVSVLCMCAFS